jgi:hypothetical protein
MKMIKYTIIAAFGTLLASCAADIPQAVDTETEGRSTVELLLRTRPYDSPAITGGVTRGTTPHGVGFEVTAVSPEEWAATAKTRQGYPGDPEDAISDLWVIQVMPGGQVTPTWFGPDDLAPPRDVPGDGDEILRAMNLLLVNVPVCRVLLIANTGNGEVFRDVTKEDIDKMLSRSWDYSTVVAHDLGTQLHNIMWGWVTNPYTGDKDIPVPLPEPTAGFPLPEGHPAGCYTVELEHLTARLTMTVEYPGGTPPEGLELTSIGVSSASRLMPFMVPKYIQWPDYGSPYSVVEEIDAWFVDYEPLALIPGEIYSWYLPHNFQGSIYSSDPEPQFSRESDPSFRYSGVSRATRVVLSGKYSDGTSSGPLSLDIYPGTSTDYSYNGYGAYDHNFWVKPNVHYIYRVTITGIDPNDTRVRFEPEPEPES